MYVANTAIACVTVFAVIGSITVAVNIEEIARAFRATVDWWRKRGEE